MPLDQYGVPRAHRKATLLMVGMLLLLAGLSVPFLMSMFADPREQNEVVELAVGRAATHTAVVAALGGPVKGSHGMSQMKTTLDDGTTIEGMTPIQGTYAAGTLYFRARRSDLKWNFEVLRLTVQPEHREINLLTEPDDISLHPELAAPQAPVQPPALTTPARPVRRRAQK